MKCKALFIQSVIKTSRKSEIRMPWSRGANRAAMIARRAAAEAARRRVQPA